MQCMQSFSSNKLVMQYRVYLTFQQVAAPLTINQLDTNTLAEDIMPKKSRTKKTALPAGKPVEGAADGSRCYFFYHATSPFSNFHPAQFVDNDGRSYFCSEQYMMYHKAMLFGDYEIAEKIMKEQSEPRKCKKLGRQVRNNFDVDIWSENAQRIVAEGVYFKFAQNPSLKRKLLATKDLELIEAAAGDRIWGIGYSADKALTVPRSVWGSNWLGEVLMIVRRQLKNEQSAVTAKEKEGEEWHC